MTTTDMSTKNTKNEILDAYYEVLQQIKETKKISDFTSSHRNKEERVRRTA